MGLRVAVELLCNLWFSAPLIPIEAPNQRDAGQAGNKTPKQHQRTNMNPLAKLTRFTRGCALTLILGAGLLQTAVRAADITMECKVAGYSTAGWILIVPGSNTGGRVQYNALQKRFYTDRVQRLEPLRITYKPTSPGEACRGGRWGGLFTFSGRYKELGTFGPVPIPFRLDVICPNDPSWDNVQADIYTSKAPYYFVKRVPIGRR
jgi:hypothetical protein